MTPANHLLLLMILCLAAQAATAQTPALKVEDNSATPKTLLQVNTDAGLLAKGTAGTGVIPATGAGTRLMWYPRKSAFRAGYVEGTEWDDVNVGEYSTAMGKATRASGYSSTAMGVYSRASGDGSVALGSIAEASGENSTAMGWTTVASGYSSTAMGYEARASGNFSTAMGLGTTAQAWGSLAIGSWNVIAGNLTSWVSTDPLFVAGNGQFGIRSNALVLYKNGNLWIAGTLTQNSDARLKEDLLPLSGVLARLERLQPTYYRFKEGTNRPRERQIGLLAQEVERVFPELVSRQGDGYLSVSYANLSAVLVEAVKEQQREIEQLRAENTALRAEQASVHNRLARLEAALQSASFSSASR